MKLLLIPCPLDKNVYNPQEKSSYDIHVFFFSFFYRKTSTSFYVKKFHNRKMYKWAFNIESEENEQKLLKFPLFFSYNFFFFFFFFEGVRGIEFEM